MIVNKNTKISKLIKEDPEVIEVIASINKHFTKLKNPILRRVLASRITVEDASKVGGVSVETFLNKLKDAGFDVEFDEPQETIGEKGIDKKKILEKTTIIRLDVRPIIESGSDPFNEIMKEVKKLRVGETIEIINSFEPVPLIRMLEKKGFNSWTERSENEVVHTFFTREKVPEKQGECESGTSGENFDEVYKSFIGKLTHVDVRHLEMPEPMTTILSEIERLPQGHALFVDHKKVPQFLLPELKERNFEILFSKKSETHLQLLIFKR